MGNTNSIMATVNAVYKLLVLWDGKFSRLNDSLQSTAVAKPRRTLPPDLDVSLNCHVGATKERLDLHGTDNYIINQAVH